MAAPTQRPARKSNLPQSLAPAGVFRPLTSTGSIHDVREQFARKPLFDGEVNRELDLMEKRSRSHVATPAATGGTLVHSSAVFGGNPFASAMDRSRSPPGGTSGAAGGPGYVLPPQIIRPFSVQQYLLSPGVHPSAGARTPLSSRQLEHESVASVPPSLPERSTQSSASRPRAASATPRRRYVRRHQVTEDAELPSTQVESQEPPTAEIDHESDTEAYTPETRGSRRRPPDLEQLRADREAAYYGAPAQAHAGFEWEKAKDDNRVATQIERAAARSQLQQERRLGVGKGSDSGRSGLLHEGVQTEPDARWGATAVGMEPKLSELFPSRFERHPSNKTPPPTGLLLTPSTPYVVANKVADVPASDQPRWKELVRPAPSSVAPSSISQAPTTEAMVTAATTAVAAPAAEPTAVEAGREAIRRITQRAATPLMERLDQLQLANEELLVRNQALPPTSLAGEAGYRARRAISRVAEAHREPAEAPLSFATSTPLGGYGSVVDVTERADDDEFSPSRWRDARLRNDAQQLGAEAATGHAELRHWAKDLTQAPHRTASEHHRGARSDATAYNARKKWGSVSFAVPLEQRGARGPLEELSNSARSLMQPPA